MSTQPRRVRLEVEKYGFTYSVELNSNRDPDEGVDMVMMAKNCINMMIPSQDRDD